MQNKDAIWTKIAAHQAALADSTISEFFDSDPARFDEMHVRLDGVLFDYSKHRVTGEALDLLIALAQACNVTGLRDQMFAGDTINTSENRAVLHTALRGHDPADLSVDGENVADFVASTLLQMRDVADAIRTDPDIHDVVSIGIGGSHMGPQLMCDALQAQSDGPRIHFVANIDGNEITEILEGLDPAHTVFVIASKTFTTLETMRNARAARDWAGGNADAFYAITGNLAAAQEFGIAAARILPLRDWIGGRYSVWGAIGLPIMIALGFDRFQAFLDGAKAMDDHFRSAELDQNIPVLMGVLGVWYRNFWDYRAHAILPYARDLARFPSFVQQLDMESSGKSVSHDGDAISHATGPVVFGEPGTNAQHAFFQLLHQGSDIIPADFIAFVHAGHDLEAHHHALLANAFAQSQALMRGRKNAQEPHRNFDGNRPSSTLLLDRLDPYHLGMLIALYEHKIFVQGVIWGINNFDQWGVELGKNLAKSIENALDGGAETDGFDSSTRHLIGHVLKHS